MYAYQLVQYATVTNVILGENSPFNVAPLHEDILKIKDNQKLLDYVKSYDLSRLISPNVMETTFACHFFKGNLAWISQNENHYRYFTRNYKGYVQSFDLLDFLKSYYETENIGKILGLLSNKTGVIFLDRRWKKKQEERYLQNLQWVESLGEKSPLAHKILAPHLDLFKVLNEEGLRHLGPMNLSVGRDAIFFSSARFLGEKIGVSGSKVSKVIIYLEGLGMIERMKDEDIPAEYLEKSMEYKGRKNRINYYHISDLSKCESEVLGKCEEFAVKRIRYTNFKSE